MPVIAGVAALDVIVLALVALLLAVAFFPMFRPLLMGALGSLPLVGTWVVSHLDLMLYQAYIQATIWADATIGPVADLVRRVRYALALTNETVVQAAESTWAAAWRLRYQVIPWAMQQAMGYALQLMVGAEQYALALARASMAYALALASQAAVYAQALYRAGLAYALAQAAAQVAYAQALFGAAIRFVQAQAAAQLAYTVAAVLSAERFAAALAAQQLAYTQAAVLGAERFAQRVGVDAEGYARALTGQAMARADARAAEVARAAAAATAVVATAVTAIERSPCMKMCGPLGDLGQALQGIEELFETGLLVALAAEAAHDPQGTARAVVAELGEVANEAADGVRAATGFLSRVA